MNPAESMRDACLRLCREEASIASGRHGGKQVAERLAVAIENLIVPLAPAPAPSSSWEIVTTAGDMRLAVPGGWIYQLATYGDNPGGVVFVPQHKEIVP